LQCVGIYGKVIDVVENKMRWSSGTNKSKETMLNACVVDKSIMNVEIIRRQTK